MTAKTPAQLILSFETGDNPTQNDYQDLIDSYLNLAQTTAQSIVSDVTVSGALTVTGVVSAASFRISGSNNFGLNARLARTAESSVNATGTAQGTARVISKDFIRVVISSAGTNDGVLLPVTSLGGDQIFVINAAAQNLKVYPPSGGNINGGSTNGAFVVSANSAYSFYGFGTNLYYTNR